MAVFLATLTPLLTLFCCIALGYTLCKAKILPDSSSKVMAKLETYVFCPALSFTTMQRYFTVKSISTHATNVLLSSFTVALAMAIAIPLSRLFVKNDYRKRCIYSYSLAVANLGYVGDPVVMAIFGDEALAYYKLFCLPFQLVIYVWGIGILIPRDKDNGSKLKHVLNPSTLAMLLGIAVGLSGIGKFIPSFLASALDSLKGCMGPVAMLLTGVTIARYSILPMLKNKKVYIATVLRLIVIPTVLISALFGLKTLINSIFSISIGNDVLFLCLFATATPLGLNTVVFPEAYGGDSETGASMATVSCTLCVITLPLMYAVATAIFGTPFA